MTNGDLVFQEWRAQGKVTGPDGKPAAFNRRGTTVTRFDDSDVRREMYTYLDVLSYLRQLLAISEEMNSALGH